MYPFPKELETGALERLRKLPPEPGPKLKRVVVGPDIYWISEVNVKPLELLYAAIYYTFLNSVGFLSSNTEGTSKMENLKGFLTGFIVRWVLKVGGGFLLSVGLSEGSVTEVVGAVIAILIGLATSLFQHNKAIEQTPPK